MNTHERIQEVIELMLYDEATAQERAEAERHLADCADCRAYRLEAQKLHGLLTKGKPVEVNETMLSDARRSLRLSIDSEPEPGSLFGGMLDRLFGKPALVAVGALATIAVGFFIGYVTFRTPEATKSSESAALIPAVKNTEVAPEAGQITNVRFIGDANPNGEVEFTFDAVMPVHMKGSAGDPKIQQVLAHALLNEQNPGVRLRSVSAIAAEPAGKPDPDVRDILISAVKSDENVGVRKEALKALQKFPMDERIKKTLVDVLAHDSNPAIRIAAINTISSMKDSSSSRDSELLSVLKERMKTDNNTYVRQRANAFLQEVRQ